MVHQDILSKLQVFLTPNTLENAVFILLNLSQFDSTFEESSTDHPILRLLLACRSYLATVVSAFSARAVRAARLIRHVLARMMYVQYEITSVKERLVEATL